jgi:hypothetical protein
MSRDVGWMYEQYWPLNKDSEFEKLKSSEQCLCAAEIVTRI